MPVDASSTGAPSIKELARHTFVYELFTLQ